MSAQYRFPSPRRHATELVAYAEQCLTGNAETDELIAELAGYVERMADGLVSQAIRDVRRKKMTERIKEVLDAGADLGISINEHKLVTAVLEAFS